MLSINFGTFWWITPWLTVAKFRDTMNFVRFFRTTLYMSSTRGGFRVIIVCMLIRTSSFIKPFRRADRSRSNLTYLFRQRRASHRPKVARTHTTFWFPRRVLSTNWTIWYIVGNHESLLRPERLGTKLLLTAFWPFPFKTSKNNVKTQKRLLEH